jgi:hypothetical protein
MPDPTITLLYHAPQDDRHDLIVVRQSNADDHRGSIAAAVGLDGENRKGDDGESPPARPPRRG